MRLLAVIPVRNDRNGHLHIVAKRDRHAFEVLPRRWVVERTFAWISKHRHTIRGYEHLPKGWHREHEWMNLLQNACGPPAATA